MYVFISFSIVYFYCTGNFISVLLRQKVGELGSDKMAATNQHLPLCSIVDLWRKHDRF